MVCKSGYIYIYSEVCNTHIVYTSEYVPILQYLLTHILCTAGYVPTLIVCHVGVPVYIVCTAAKFSGGA